MAVTINQQIPRMDEPFVDGDGRISRAWFNYLSSLPNFSDLPAPDIDFVSSITGVNTNNADPLNPVVRISVDETSITGEGTPASPLVAATQGLTGYIVADLPTGAVGDRAYVTDGSGAAAFLSVAVGSGSIVAPVFFDGSDWVFG